MYKDKTKQKEAVLKAVRRHRGITQGITLTPDNIKTVIPVVKTVIPNDSTTDELTTINPRFTELDHQTQQGIISILRARKNYNLEDDTTQRLDMAIKYKDTVH